MSLFGAKASTSPPQTGGLFGGAPTAAPSAAGQTSLFGTTGAPAGIVGATTGGGLFGSAATTNQPSGTSLFAPAASAGGAAPSSSLFGTAAALPPTSGATTATGGTPTAGAAGAGSLFGTAGQTASSAKGPSGLFLSTRPTVKDISTLFGEGVTANLRAIDEALLANTSHTDQLRVSTRKWRSTSEGIGRSVERMRSGTSSLGALQELMMEENETIRGPLDSFLQQCKSLKSFHTRVATSSSLRAQQVQVPSPEYSHYFNELRERRVVAVQQLHQLTSAVTSLLHQPPVAAQLKKLYSSILYQQWALERHHSRCRTLHDEVLRHRERLQHEHHIRVNLPTTGSSSPRQTTSSLSQQANPNTVPVAHPNSVPLTSVTQQTALPTTAFSTAPLSASGPGLFGNDTSLYGLTRGGTGIGQQSAARPTGSGLFGTTANTPFSGVSGSAVSGGGWATPTPVPPNTGGGLFGQNTGFGTQTKLW